MADSCDDSDNESYSQTDYELHNDTPTLIDEHESCCNLVYDLDAGHNDLIDNSEYYFKGVLSLLRKHLENGFNNIECCMNELVNSVSVACITASSGDISTGMKKEFCDLYLRVRHEIFFRLCIKLTSFQSEHSDEKFSDVFDIESDKTPDKIFVNGNLVSILEVTVTTNVEQASFQKGGLGYTPKYIKEIDALIILGFDVHYCVCILDASDNFNKDHYSVLKAMCLHQGLTYNSDFEIDMDYYQSEITSMQKFVTKFFVGELVQLFSEPYSLTPKINDQISGLMSENTSYSQMAYSQLTVNIEIYNKLMFRWSRLSTYLSRFKFDDKVSLYYDFLRPNFRFKLHSIGSKVSDWHDALEKDDRIFVVLNTYTELADKIEKLTHSERGLHFYVLQKKTLRNPILSSIRFKNYSVLHPFDFKVENYVLEINDEEDDFHNVCSKYEDLNYELKVLKAIKNWDSNPSFDKLPEGMLCNSENTKKSSIAALKRFETKLLDCNNFEVNIPVRSFKHKNSFMYPIADLNNTNFVHYRHKPTIFLNGLLKEGRIGNYTKAILGKSNTESFEFGTMIDPRLFEPEYNNIRQKYISANLKYHKAAKDFAKTNGLKSIPNKKEFSKACAESTVLYEDLIKTKRDFDRYVDVKNLPKQKLPLVKINSRSKNSCFRKFFESETTHFNKSDEQSRISGVGLQGDLDKLYDKQKHLYNSLKRFLLAPSSIKTPDKIMDVNTYDDVKLLKDFKDLHMNDTSSKLNKLEGTNLYNSCSFVSRLCHSLMYYSQCSFSADYIAVDNIGMDNVILMVRGGKKIFRTKQTKMFKLIYPVNLSYSDYLTDNQTSSSILHEIDSLYYLETPWMFMKEALVAEGICFLHKCVGYALMNWKESSSLYHSVDTCYFNIYLAFHSRRKTEEFMHNFRYLLVNNMGYYSNLEGLLPEFAGFNYDYVQQYLRLSLLMNYVELSESMRTYKKNNNLQTALTEANLTHMFNGHQITDLEGLSMFIYSSYLMTKAPIDQMTEQLKNLKSVMETHETAMAELGSNQVFLRADEELTSYTNRLFESDFNYDPYMCTLIGKFMSDFLLTKNTKSDMTKIWESTLNKNWDSMANSKGLRGDMGQEGFFGEKGYYVICQELVKNGKLNDVLKILNSDFDDYKKRSEISKLNETFRSQCSKNLDELIFHVVDKRQRGGSREIYVMSMKTKLHQQPIETFLSKLCKKIPNELISVPSNKRLQNIHSQVFEKSFDTTNKENYYLTLDCRKWAPKSNIDKYVLFILGMSECLPSGFVKHFLNFFSLMYEKKNVTRKKVMENFLKSESNKKYEKWFRTMGDSSYFEMPYSFMMGIFNFLSSLMHVSNQMYLSYLINLSSKENLGRDSYLHMLAHSDDSAGKAVVANEGDMKRLLFLYELGLKSANHLISIKKSVVSKVYFEFLSVLYIMNQLVPLLPKFMSGITFRPVDKGYCVDALQSYSKCIELILNGAHFEQAYVYMKIQSHLIWRFYFNDNPKPDDYLIPPQLGGMPDPHPISVLLIGTDSDLMRIKYSLGDEAAGLIIRFSNLLAIETSSEEGLLKSFCARPNIRPSKTLFINQMEIIVSNAEELSNSWAIKNLSFKNTSLNLMQTVLKANDPTFLAALQDEEVIRRISRAYFFRSSQCIETKLGFISYRQLRKYFNCVNTMRFSEEVGVRPVFEAAGIQVDEDALKILNFEIKDQTNLINKISSILYTEVVKYYNYMNRIRLNERGVEMKFKTCKPVHMNIMRTAQPLSNIEDMASIIIWTKEPQYKFLLSNVSGLETASGVLKSYLTDSGLDFESLDCTLAYKLARKIFTSSEKDYYFYSNMPAGCRDINNYQDICLMLANNSKKDQYFTGLNIPFSRSPGVLLGDYMPTVSVEEFVETVAYLSLIIAAYSTGGEKVNLINDLEWMTPTFLNPKPVDVDELLRQLINYWKPSQICYGYINTYLELSSKLVSDEVIVDSSGNLAGDLNFITKGYFYVYTKAQKLVNNRWMGRGKILINTPNGAFTFQHDGNRLTHIQTTVKKGSLSKLTIEYINMVFSESRLQTLQYNFRPLTGEQSVYNVIGVDRNGIVCVDSKNNLEFGFENIEYLDCLQEIITLKHFKSAKLESTGSLLICLSDELESRNNWRVCFYPLDMAAVSKHIMTLFASPDISLKNYQLASRGTGHFGSYIRSNLLSMFDRPLYVTFENFFSGIRCSRMFKIMSVLKSREPHCFDDLYTFDSPSGPSPSNGLLAHLVNYKDIDPNFKFDTEPFLTQHLMAIKSQQPEQYLSTLERHMKTMYENLYTQEEKEEMLFDLNVAIKSLTQSEKDSSNKIMNLMAKWGYGSLMQGVSEFRIQDSEKLHDVFVRENLKPKLSSILAEKSHFLLRCFYDVFKKNKHILPECFIDKKYFDMGYNFNTFERHFYSFCALLNYWRYKVQTFVYTNDSPSGLFVMQMIYLTLNNEILAKEFKRCLLDDELFMHFRVCPEDFEDWVITFCSCVHYYLVKFEVNIKGSLLLDLQYDRLESYNSFKKFDFGDLVSYHSFKKFGLFSDQLASDLKKKCAKSNHYYNPTIKTHARMVPLCKGVVFEGVISEDAFDSDEWESLIMEVTSNCPDMDEVESAIEAITEEVGEFYSENTDKTKGDLTFHQLSIISSMCSSKTRLFSFCSRQVGDNILVISDSFDEDFLESMPNTRAYKPGKSWKFHLLTREMVCILVSFRNGIPEGFAQCYDLLPIQRQKENTYRKALLKTGVKVDLGDWQRMSSMEKNQLQLRLTGYAKTTKDSEEPSEGISEEKEEVELKDDESHEVKKLLDSCEKRGLSKESSSKLLEIMSTMKGTEDSKDIDELLRSLLLKTLETQKTMNDIKAKMSETIKSTIQNRSQLETILQVPQMLQRGSKMEKNRSNIHFRDEQIRAELDSLSSGLTDIIVSGTLTITKEEREELVDVIELCDNYLRNNKGSPEAIFFTMLVRMIMNDAFHVEEETREHTPIWKNIRRKLISKVVKTKGNLIQHGNPFEIQPTEGHLNYKFSGFPED